MNSPSPNYQRAMPTWALPAVSWLISFYFFFGFVLDVGFPPRIDVTTGHLFYAGLWLFFLFLPFFRKIKIGHFLELEREIEQTKTDLRDFKSEVRNSLAVISTNVNTMGNLSNQVTVNVPGAADLDDLRRKLDELSQPKTRDEAREILTELAAIDGEDQIMALARTRIRIEFLLREILGKRASVRDDGSTATKFMSLSQLTREFFDRFPHHRDLEQSMKYVLQVCNAAIHAQRISEGQASEALELGSRVLAILSDLRHSPKDDA